MMDAGLMSIVVAMVLTDASMYFVSTEALLKVEQGYKQEALVAHLFELLRAYC